MEEALLDVIREISERKKQDRSFPVFVLKIEVYNAVRDSLNNLYRQGKIRVGKTLNDKWIEIVADSKQ